MHFRHVYLALMAFIVLASALILNGCATDKNLKPVYQIQTQYQEVPAELTASVLPPVPISRAGYMTKTIYERESYLADYSVQALKSLHSCNTQLSSISVLSQKWKEGSDASKQKD